MAVTAAKKKAAEKKEATKRRMSRTTIDKKTGRRRVKNTKAAAAGRRAGAKRRGKSLSAATKRKIALAMKKFHRTKKTKTGRRGVVAKAAPGSVKAKTSGSKPAKAPTKKANLGVPTSKAQPGGKTRVKVVKKG